MIVEGLYSDARIALNEFHWCQLNVINIDKTPKLVKLRVLLAFCDDLMNLEKI